MESKLGEGSIFKVMLPVKLVNDVENKKSIKFLDNKSDKINIEFSDIYSI